MSVIVLHDSPKVIYDKTDMKGIVSFSLMVKTGVSNESTDNNGISHLLEHSILRGQNKPPLNEYFDSIGGKYNAFTAREYTCYYAKVLTEDFLNSFSILADYVVNPTFNEEDLRIEKDIVLEEFLQYEDDLVQKTKRNALAYATHNHPISFNILGERQTLESIDLTDLYLYHHQYYRPNNLVITISGDLTQEDLDDTKKMVNRLYKDQRAMKESNFCNVQGFTKKAGEKNERILSNKSYICQLYPGYSRLDTEKVLSLGIINYALAGSRTSILNNTLRETNGYVYNLYSYPLLFDQGGFLGFFTSTTPSKEKEVIQVIKESINQLIEKGISNTLFNSAKKSLKSEYIFQLESIQNRMFFHGEKALFSENYFDNFEQRIDEISQDEVATIVKEIFMNEPVTYIMSGEKNKKENISNKPVLID
ncbi:insulinase family protein [Rossellomorea aquimaris]|nr:insulinase family protein [Rossellomorea aquimaris]